MRNGTRALTNIRRYQKSGDPLLCKSHMQKLIRAFVGDKATTKLKIEKDAFHVLQMGLEEKGRSKTDQIRRRARYS